MFEYLVVLDAIDEFIQSDLVYSFVGQDIHLRPVSGRIRDIDIDHLIGGSQIEFEHEDIIKAVIIIILVGILRRTGIVDGERLIDPVEQVEIFGIYGADHFHVIGILQGLLISSEQLDLADIKRECCRRIPSELV